MKSFLIYVLVLTFLISVNTFGYDNNITIGIDKIGAHRVGPVDLPVLWENDNAIQSSGNGYVITCDEGMTVWFEEGAGYADCFGRCSGSEGWHFRYLSSVGDTTHPDIVNVGHPYYPGIPYMVGPGPMEPCYHLFINFEGAYGNIYVDSIFEPPHGWIWSCFDQHTYPNFNYDGSTHVIHYGSYSCGDTDKSGGISISDAVGIIRYVFIGAQPPDPIESGDVNCDGLCNVSDAIGLINYVFAGGSVPCDTDGDSVPDC